MATKKKTSPATTSAHTKGPWFFDKSAHKGTGLLIFGKNVHHEPIDHLYNLATLQKEPVYESVVLAELDPVPEMEANAKFIVRACNNHEALIDALEIAANAMKRVLMYETPGSAEYQEYSWVLETIHHTLNNAYGNAA